MPTPQPLQCVWCVAVGVRCLSSVWWAGFSGPGLSFFVCLPGSIAVGSVWLGAVCGGVPGLFWGACPRVPRVVCCGFSFPSGTCSLCCRARSGWSFLLLGWGSGGSACGCCAERYGGCAYGCAILLPLAGVGVGAGTIVAPGLGLLPVHLRWVFLCRPWRGSGSGSVLAVLDPCHSWLCVFALGCRWWCGWRCFFGVCGGGGSLGLTGALWGSVWGCPSGLGGCVLVCFCGVPGTCMWVWFLKFLAGGWYRCLCAACSGFQGVACYSCVGLAAVCLGVGPPTCWCGDIWWCRSPPFLT